jgi:putative aldouronate transport system substrate-binding protein
MVLLLCIPLTTTFAGGNQEADDDIYEIVWHHIGADIPEGDKEQFLNEVNAYLEEKIGVRVNYDPYDWGDYTERMTLIANSGEAWDLAFTASWAFNYQDNARRGNFLAVNDLLDEYGQGILKDMAPQFIEGNKIDEKLYAVATNKEVGTWPILTIPTAMVEKYNIDTSLEYWTYENLEPAYAQFKRDFPNDYPLWPEGINSAQMAWEHIGPIFNPDIPIVQYISGSDFQIYNQFEIPEQIEHLKMLRKFLDAGYIHPDIPALEAEQQRVINILQEGKFIAKYDLAFPGAEPALENRYRQPVVFKGMTAPVSENSSISGSMLAISVNSERPDKVMQFLNLLNSDPYVRNAFNWGIEGVHYDKIADNRIRINPDNSWTLPQFSLQNFFYTLAYRKPTRGSMGKI